MLRTLALRDAVSDGLTIHVLVNEAQLNSHAGNRGRLLRSVDTLHVLNQPLRGDTIAVSADSVANLSRKALVHKARLGNGLFARGGELRVHLGEHVHHLRVIGATLNGEGDSVGASNAVVLGSHRATPICPRRDYFLARPCA